MTEKLKNNLSDQKRKFRRIFVLITIVFAIIIYAFIVFFRSFPEIQAEDENINTPEISADFTWPNYGEAAVGASDYGVLGTNGEQTSKPIASIAKTILALAVLKEKPLQLGEQGSTYTITNQDIEFYKETIAQNGSNVPVQINETLSEYQLLEALLIPSGDNIADTLAVWVFGSLENYLDYANKMLAQMKLTKTHMADASGLSPESVSSAQDLITIGEEIMKNPVLAEIVGKTQVDLPIIGTVKNYNTLLGKNNINGIKTGNTDEAGGCLLSSAKMNIDGKDITIVATVLGATSRAKVLIDTDTFFKNNLENFKFIEIIASGQTIGSYDIPWQGKVEIVAKNNLSVLASKTQKIELLSSFNKINSPVDKDVDVGTITTQINDNQISVPAVLKNAISAPSFWWKILHP